ncbi:aflE/ norA/ aad/ adh-2/ NOR reductase/ dehydrogenase [Aspergillus bombycis]|uniref:AflE/ norA/ aad/ adh-2/ NOR reductase/ dehydrogenase n=1 Tax=Aspergillus bombycis TaxID=109264 RepID=A0A1F8A6U3_9EURO|nr:aflE/ norA/ aad/ adh-2/ NOR reductase/ dehydrogenase [Aspergillus bombycis]OGM47413.1 aflE/ norA/ aad/ adh-2/ NOR reductase/ dehydrogenase [Aspergillus bombycis]
MVLPSAPEPPTLLGYHRILSPSAGVRVSPLCLGTMSFGNGWKGVMGECDQATSFNMLDTFYESGGNFIDVANFYQGGDSERWVGEWMTQRRNRDEIVFNHAKSLRLSVKASLEKLQTDYIDLLYVHMWDFTTSVEEVMRSLNHLVANGKVLYLGVSDTPAWLVVKCNAFARANGLTPFSVYQGHWSCAFRDFERDILPMCESEGMGLAPWGVLGRGQFRSAEDFSRDGRKMGPQDEKHRRLGEKLDQMAQRKDTKATSIAQAYVMHKAPYVFPVIGGRKVEHLKDNIEALNLVLSEEEIHEIDDAEPFDVGFPMNFLFETPVQRYRVNMTSKDIWQLSCNTRLETVPKQQPIEPLQARESLLGQTHRKYTSFRLLRDSIIHKIVSMSDSHRLDGKVAVVTGAGRGIGAAIAVALGERGAKVVVNYAHSREAAEKVVQQIKANGTDAIAIQADVGDPEATAKLMAETVRHFGYLDIVSSNAGVVSFGHLKDVTPEEFDRVFRVNTRGQFFVAREAYRHMREGGRIILTSSNTACVKGVPKHAVYSGSKGAIDTFVRCMAIDCGDKKITVNAVAPGAIKTDMFLAVSREYIPNGESFTDEQVDECAAWLSPLNRVGQPVDVARVVSFLASDAAEWVSGKIIGVDGGAFR